MSLSQVRTRRGADSGDRLGSRGPKERHGLSGQPAADRLRRHPQPGRLHRHQCPRGRGRAPLHVALATPAAPDAPGDPWWLVPARELQAELVGIDRETDLAVLKVQPTGLPFAPPRPIPTRLQAAQVVLALGSPLGLASTRDDGRGECGRPTASAKTIGWSTSRPTPRSIRATAAGRWSTADGAVAGHQHPHPQPVGRQRGDRLRGAEQHRPPRRTSSCGSYGRVRRGDIGVFAQTITPAMATGLRLPQDWGVVLGDVYPGGPARRPGLQTRRRGPLGERESGRERPAVRRDALPAAIWAAGRRSTCGRGLQRLTMRVPGDRATGRCAARFGDLVTPEHNLVPRLGVLGLDMTKELARAFPGCGEPAAWWSRPLTPDATTGPGGLQPGDVIYALERRRRVAPSRICAQSLASVAAGDIGGSPGRPAGQTSLRHGDARVTAIAADRSRAAGPGHSGCSPMSEPGRESRRCSSRSMSSCCCAPTTSSSRCARR